MKLDKKKRKNEIKLLKKAKNKNNSKINNTKLDKDIGEIEKIHPLNEEKYQKPELVKRNIGKNKNLGDIDSVVNETIKLENTSTDPAQNSYNDPILKDIKHKSKLDNIFQESSKNKLKRKSSLPIYQHVPWYTFQPTIKTMGSSSSIVLSKSKSESNMIRPYFIKSDITNSAHEFITPKQNSICPSLKMDHSNNGSNNESKNIYHNNNNHNEKNNSYIEPQKTEPEKFKSLIFEILKYRENDFCYHLSQHNHNYNDNSFDYNHDKYEINENDLLFKYSNKDDYNESNDYTIYNYNYNRENNDYGYNHRNDKNNYENYSNYYYRQTKDTDVNNYYDDGAYKDYKNYLESNYFYNDNIEDEISDYQNEDIHWNSYNKNDDDDNDDNDDDNVDKYNNEYLKSYHYYPSLNRGNTNDIYPNLNSYTSNSNNFNSNSNIIFSSPSSGSDFQKYEFEDNDYCTKNKFPIKNSFETPDIYYNDDNFDEEYRKSLSFGLQSDSSSTTKDYKENNRKVESNSNKNNDTFNSSDNKINVIRRNHYYLIPKTPNPSEDEQYQMNCQQKEIMNHHHHHNNYNNNNESLAKLNHFFLMNHGNIENKISHDKNKNHYKDEQTNTINKNNDSMNNFNGNNKNHYNDEQTNTINKNNDSMNNFNGNSNCDDNTNNSNSNNNNNNNYNNNNNNNDIDDNNNTNNNNYNNNKINNIYDNNINQNNNNSSGSSNDINTSYDLCICSRNGSCHCSPDCYCKKTMLNGLS